MDTTPLFWAGALGLLASGLAGSVHCTLMCGPLACAALPAGGAASRRALIAAWQSGRILAYLLVGAALGLAGQGLVRALAGRIQPYLPWVMAVGLAATALELGRRLRPLPGIARLSGGLARLGQRLSPARRAFALGAATPFLPCGLLYGIFVVAIAAGGPIEGAAVLGLFGLGAIPALAAVQLGASGWGRYPRVGQVLRRVVPLVAAAVLVWRALATPAGGGAPNCH